MEPYIPEQLPLKNLDYARLFGIVGRANAALARYDGLLQGIVNPQVMLSPLTTQEAVLSSKIEGTQATLDEVLEHEAGIEVEQEKQRDIQEIVNYRTALTNAKDYLADRPISLGLLREMHKVLLDSVRGQDKSPGEFRKEQNWIGPYGVTFEQATFVPPSPFQLMNHLEQWETYLRGNDIDILLQAGVVHAQFELIHPFKDGNGRIGRLLIPLFLYQKKCISSPMFYLSAYLEEHREDYYQALRNISQQQDWNTWLLFFLQSIEQQATENATRVRKIHLLYDEMKERIRTITHSQYTIQALDGLFDRPIFQTSDFVKRTEIPKQTAMPMLRQLKEAGILTTLREASGRRSTIYAFKALLNTAEGKEIV
jgi:Fic family protein